MLEKVKLRHAVVLLILFMWATSFGIMLLIGMPVGEAVMGAVLVTLAISAFLGGCILFVGLIILMTYKLMEWIEEREGR